MLAQFSYKNHFLLHLLRNSKELFPGATRVAALYYNKETLGLSSYEIDLESEDEKINQLQLKQTIQSNLEDFRKQRPRYSWLDKNLFLSPEKENQLKIHREFENHTLLIRFPSSGDGLNDLLLIFFKNEEHVFRVSGKAKKLSTELKQSLASVYVRNLDVIRKQVENDFAIYEVIRSFSKKSKQTEEELASALIAQKKETLLIYRSIAEKFTNKTDPYGDYDISWNEEAITFLSTHYHDLAKIEEVVKRALIIAINSTSSKKIVIGPTLLFSEDKAEKKSISQEISIRYQRTHSLLDRYEEAALEVIKKKLSLTGANLGIHLNPSITAAAISDAIKKHSSKIIHLLNKYPDRWSILRSHFRPIQNKIINKDILDQLAS